MIFYKRRDDGLRIRPKIPSSFVNDFSTDSVTIPCKCTLKEGTVTETFQIRYLEKGDLQRVCDMCYREYSSGPATLENFPITEPLKIFDWIDKLTLRPVVDFTMELKVNPKPSDHAILIATIDNTVVGMVEVSRQSIDPERPTSPFPLPIWWKKAEAQLEGKSTVIQAWITNLLVAPEFRGKGISKALVAACEYQARRWNLASIHLHCDAGTQSGKIPQSLYESMGYTRKPKDPSEYAWERPFIEPSVYNIDGVPLLYLRKKL